MPQEMYEIHKQLGSINSKLDAIMHIGEKHEARMDHHSKRIAGVEKRQNWFLGLGAGATMVIGALGTMIKKGTFSG